jgi:hypothetical protein
MIFTNFWKIASASIVYHFCKCTNNVLNRRIPGLEVRTLIWNSVVLETPLQNHGDRKLSSLYHIHIYNWLPLWLRSGWFKFVISKNLMNFFKKISVVIMRVIYWVPFSQSIMLKFLKVHVSDLLLESSGHCTTMVT